MSACPPARPRRWPAGTPEQNAATTRAILAGEPGPERELALINAGAAIYAAGRADSIAHGVQVATEAIDGGGARRRAAVRRGASPAVPVDHRRAQAPLPERGRQPRGRDRRRHRLRLRA